MRQSTEHQHSILTTYNIESVIYKCVLVTMNMLQLHIYRNVLLSYVVLLPYIYSILISFVCTDIIVKFLHCLVSLLLLCIGPQAPSLHSIRLFT